MLDFLAKVLSCGKLQGGDLELFITALLDVAKDIAVAVLEAVRAFLSSLGFTTGDFVEGSAEALSAASADPCLSGASRNLLGTFAVRRRLSQSTTSRPGVALMG